MARGRASRLRLEKLAVHAKRCDTVIPTAHIRVLISIVKGKLRSVGIEEYTVGCNVDGLRFGGKSIVGKIDDANSGEADLLSSKVGILV